MIIVLCDVLLKCAKDYVHTSLLNKYELALNKGSFQLRGKGGKEGAPMPKIMYTLHSLINMSWL